MLKDIRTTSGEEHWEELRRRWTSLLSYRYLGRSHANLNSGPADPTMQLRHDMRNVSGGIMAAPFASRRPRVVVSVTKSPYRIRSSTVSRYSTTPVMCAASRSCPRF